LFQESGNEIEVKRRILKQKTRQTHNGKYSSKLQAAKNPPSGVRPSSSWSSVSLKLSSSESSESEITSDLGLARITFLVLAAGLAAGELLESSDDWSLTNWVRALMDRRLRRNVKKSHIPSFT
jgi:hypothetical protein